MAFDSSGGSNAKSSWTLRKTLARKSDTPKTFNIAVVGLSGSEKERGCLGSGKSCLCNRFVRPFADDYYTDHISVLSQSDFNGRIVNNDHWLYWGEVSKITEEGVELHFSVMEQTEFIDDACLQPFRTGKTEPYFKRCSATKLSSSEKLMYICKNQLGIEKEYEQRYLPDGKFNVDGFVCVLDVSEIQGRSFEKAIEQTLLILSSLIKTKKPIVLATTKNDEAVDLFIREAERLVNRKDFRGMIPLIETSAHENVNVDLAFVICAQLHDRSKGRAKIIPYYEAVRYRKDALDYASDAYTALLRLNITDYRTLWHTVCKSLSLHPEFMAYVDLFGQDAAHLMFKRHVKRLRDESISRKLAIYFRVLPDILAELVPDLESLLPQVTWDDVKLRLRQHPDFHQFFVENPPHIEWHDIDLISMGENRIPWDLMESPEAAAFFLEHARALEGEDRRKELKAQFRQQLGETGFVTPGKRLNEVRVFFMGRECFEALSEQDLQEVYEEHQREITEISKRNFQELLLEHSDLFYHFASFGPGSVITQEDIFKITQILSDDVRFTALERMEQDRMLMLLRHLGFIHGPIREHCPAFPNCYDVLIEKAVQYGCRGAKGIASPSANGHNRHQQWDSVSEASLSIVILGSGGLGHELARGLKAVNNKISVNGIHYTLDLRVIDGDIDLAHHSFTTNDFVPQGCLCIYSNHQTLEYVTDSVEKTLLSNLEAEEDRLPFLGLPLSILYAAEIDASDKDRAILCEEGENRARSLQCPFFDVTYSTTDRNSSAGSLGSSDSPSNDNSYNHMFNEDGIRRALVSLIDCFQQKSASNPLNVLTAKNSHHYQQQQQQMHSQHKSQQQHKSQHSLSSSSLNTSKILTPDLRLLVCFLCGDPFDLQHFLEPFLKQRSCSMTAANSFAFEFDLSDNPSGTGGDSTGSSSGGSRSRKKERKTKPTTTTTKVIELILTSYHGAQAFRDELLHGFVLVYSSQRRASLATLAAFTRNIPNTPTQMIVIRDGSPSFVVSGNATPDQIEPELISDGQGLADKIRAHFVSCFTRDLRALVLEDFLHDALERKPQIEAAFDMEDSESSLIHEPQLSKVPPPIPSRQESYDVTGLRRNEDPEDDDYEELPDEIPGDGTNSPFDLPQHHPSRSIPSHLSARGHGSSHHFSAGNRDDEQEVPSKGQEMLVKPSQVKNRRSFQTGRRLFSPTPYDLSHIL